MSSRFQLISDHTNTELLHKEEATFSLANGHIGIRGVLEEDFLTKESYDNNTYLYGFFEQTPIVYGELAYGYAKNHQTIAPVPSGHGFAVIFQNQIVSLNTGKVNLHKRVFDMELGRLTRFFEWESDAGHRILIESERTIIQTPDNETDFVIKYKVTPLNFNDTLTIKSFYGVLGPHNSLDGEDPRKKNTHSKTVNYKSYIEEGQIFFDSYAQNSKKRVYTRFNEETQFMGKRHIETNHHNIILKYEIDAKAMQSYTIYGVGKYSQEPLEKCLDLNIESILFENKQTLKEFWESSLIEVEGNNELNAAITFNLYHLYQSAGRTPDVNIAAKGLSGPGYEGHYFWDTEMYMIHPLIYTQPSIAKKLLIYRYNILGKAKKRAQELGIKSGVLFPWRTIDGEETSAYYPAGSAQVHINGDIAYAVTEYYLATHDKEFMKKYGVEILVETARFWLSYGEFVNDEFVINGVTGPDEYTALVNNNYYTNKMAQENLVNAIKYAVEFNYPHLDNQEVENWKKAADKIRLPFSKEYGLTMQDDSIFDKTIWDFENTPKNNYPLLLHYHPMIIYRHQVNKQADTVLAHYLFFDEQHKTQIEKDYHYYESITTHDSSLSKSIFGIVASLLNDKEKAYQYFLDNVYMDINDAQGNVVDGIHTANMGGMWQSLVKGFAGFTMRNGIASFTNHLPSEIESLTFRMKIHNSLIKVKLLSNEIEINLLDGEKIEIIKEGQKYVVQ